MPPQARPWKRTQMAANSTIGGLQRKQQESLEIQTGIPFSICLEQRSVVTAIVTVESEPRRLRACRSGSSRKAILFASCYSGVTRTRIVQGASSQVGWKAHTNEAEQHVAVQVLVGPCETPLWLQIRITSLASVLTSERLTFDAALPR